MLLKYLSDMQHSKEEPLLNLICFYEEEKWNLIVIPRKIHRPKQFFEDEQSKLLISPASVDMMGLLITPREEDFNSLTQEVIEDIYTQVLYGEAFMNGLIQIFK